MDILHVIIESDGGSNSAQLPLITIFGSHSFPHNVWGMHKNCVLLCSVVNYDRRTHVPVVCCLVELDPFISSFFFNGSAEAGMIIYVTG